MDILSNSGEAADDDNSEEQFPHVVVQTDNASRQVHPVTEDKQIPAIEEDKRETERHQQPVPIEALDVEIDHPSILTDENGFTKPGSLDVKHGGCDTKPQNSVSSHEDTVSKFEQGNDTFRSEKPETSLDSIYLKLFEFSHRYEEIENDLNSTDKLLDQVPLGQIPAEGFMVLCQKIREERQRFRELVGKMLLDCNISEGRKDFSENFETISEETIPRTDGKKTTYSKNDARDDEPGVNKVESETNSARTITGLLRDLEDSQEKFKKMEQERNRLQEKVFEVESELCSAEIERDLKSEEARYLEEQVGSIRSMLSMRDDELVSLRKRYRFLNEAFQNSEELREGLEKDTSRMTVTIRDLEERLEKTTQCEGHGVAGGITDSNLAGDLEKPKESYGHGGVCEVVDHNELSQEVGRLQREVSAANDELLSEKSLKESVEDMLRNVENERRLVVEELDTFKDLHKKQEDELQELRKLKHHTTKQQQKQQEQQQQDTKETENRLQSKQMAELQERMSQLSCRILLLEEENKKLEEEVYQNLDIIEKMEAENTVLRQERENILIQLKNVHLETTEELFSSYYELKIEKEAQGEKLKQYERFFSDGEASSKTFKNGKVGMDHSVTVPSTKEADMECPEKLCSVPRSEYVKVKFQLKSLQEEMKYLKEVTVPRAMKNFSVATTALKEERTSLKKENKFVKKWLKTMKESISAVTVEDELVAKHSVMLENQLHEAKMSISQHQHELEMMRKEKDILSSEKVKQEEALVLLKQRLIEDQEIHKKTLDELKKNFKELEKRLQDETEDNKKDKSRIISLEECNVEVSNEFENLKHQFESLLKEKRTLDEKLSEIKLDVLKYFGNESLQSVSNSWTTTKRKCSEYAKIIENDKEIISKGQRELVTLADVNTVLRKELDDANTQLEKERKLNSQQNEIVTSQKLEIEQLQALIHALEIGRKNEQEVLEAFMKEKKEWEEAQKNMDVINFELKQARASLSKKEKECETSRAIIQELEATCQVYEEEFEKLSIASRKKDSSSPSEESALLSNLTVEQCIDSEDEDLSENENDSTVKNFRDLQEMVQERLAIKVQFLQSKLTECKEDNISEVVEENDADSKPVDSLLLDKELHEARINLNEKIHEIVMLKKEKGILVSEKEKQEEALSVLKQRLVKDQQAHEEMLQELRERLKEVEKQLQDEMQHHAKEKAKVVSLAEQNAEVSDEFENVKIKLEFLQNEKQTVDQQLDKIKLDVLKYFGSESLQSVSDSWIATKKKCNEYEKIIENDRDVISKGQREMDALKKEMAALTDELDDVKVQLMNENRLHCQKVDEVITQKREIERLQAVIHALEIGRKNEQDILETYMNEKREWEKAQIKLNSINSELHQTKSLLSEKEKECEMSMGIIQELETTCRVYEEEFEKISFGGGKKDASSKMHHPVEGTTLLSDLTLTPTSESENDEHVKTKNSSNDSDVQEFQDMVHGRLSVKVQGLQKRLAELMEALFSCQKLNVTLQERLHSAEMKHLESEEEISYRKRNEELDKMLKELSEKEKSTEGMMGRYCAECHGKNSIGFANNANFGETLSRYKEIIKCLRADNKILEGKLAEAEEEIKKQKQSIAMLEHCIRDTDSNGENMKMNDGPLLDEAINHFESQGSDADTKLKRNSHNHLESVILEDENTPSPFVNEERVSTSQISTGGHTTPLGSRTTTRSVEEELVCVTAKYTNLKAAFEGCRRRLGILEAGDEEMVEKVGLGTLGERNRNLLPMTEKTTPDPQKENTPFQRDMFSQTDEFSENVYPLFSKMSVSVLENEADPRAEIGEHCMAVEVTLTESEMDHRQVECDSTKTSAAETELENYCCQLKTKIEKLEGLVVASRNEVQRIKECSLKEKLDFENNLKNFHETINMAASKSEELEQEKKKLESRIEELEAKLLLCDQEMQRIHAHDSKEKHNYEEIIKKSQEANYTMRMRTIELETEKEKLRVRIEELEENFLNQKATLGDIIKALEKTIQEFEKQERFKTTRMDQLEDKILSCNEETQQIKVSLFHERGKNQDAVQTLESTVVSQRKRCERLKEENYSLISKINDLEARLLVSDGEKQQDKNCLLDEKKNLEHTIKKLQDTITAMEKRIQEESKAAETAKLKIKDLEKTVVSSKEEIKQGELTILNEREKLEHEINDLKDALTNMKQKVGVQETEKQQLQLRTRELEAEIQKCIDETQRMKVCSLNQQQNLENAVQEKAQELSERKEIFERESTLYKSRISELEKKVRELEDEYLVIAKEVTSTKDQLNAECQTRSELEGKLAMTSVEVEKLCDDNKRLSDVCDELRNNNKHLETALAEYRVEEEVWREKLNGKQKQINDLEKAKVELTFEFSREKENIKDIERNASEAAEKLRLENDNLMRKYKDEQCVVESKIRELQEREEENKLLNEKLIDSDEKLQALKEVIENAQKEDVNLQERLSELENVFDLKANVEELENEKKKLLYQVEKMEEELKTNDAKMIGLEQVIGNLREESSSWKHRANRYKEEISVLTTSMSNLENEKRSLQEDSERMNKVKHNDEIEKTTLRKDIDDFERKVEVHEEEMTVLRKKLMKLEKEKETSESLLAEINEQRNKEEESVHEVIEQHHREINSWKEKMLLKEEEVTTLEDNLKQLANESIAAESLLHEMNDRKQRDEKYLQEIIQKHEEDTNSWKQKIIAAEEELTMLRKHVEHIEIQKENVENKIGELHEQSQKEKENVQNIVEKYEKEIESLRQEIRSHEDERAIVRKNLEQLQDERTSTERFLAEMNEQKRTEEQHFLKTVDVYEKEIVLLKKAIAKLENQKENAEKALTEINHEKQREENRFEEMIQKMRDENESSKEDASKNENEISRLKIHLDQLESEKNNGEINLRSAHEMCENLRQENLSLEQKVALSGEDLVALRKNVEELKYARDNMIQSLEEMDAEKHTNLRKIEALNNDVEKLRQEKGAVIHDLANCRKEHSELKTLVTELEKQKTDTDDELRDRTLQLESKDEEVEQLKVSCEQLHQENERNDKLIKNYENESTNLKNIVNELKKMKADLENELRESELKQENQTKQLRDFKIHIEGLEKEKNDLNQIISDDKERICDLEEKFSILKKDMENIQLRMNEEQEKHEDEVKSLNKALKSSDARELVIKDEFKVLEKETANLRNEIAALVQKNEDDKKEKSSLESNIESRSETLRILHINIEEASRRKSGVEEELRVLKLTIDKETSAWKEGKENHNQDLKNIKEIIDELMKGKQTLLEEISKLSDEKKEREMANSEVLKIKKAYDKLQIEHETLKKANSGLEIQISSLKISLDTLQNAYEQSQDENKQNERRIQELRNEDMKRQDKQKLVVENGRLKKQIGVLENKLKNSATENKELFSSLDEVENRLSALEKELEKSKNENVVLTERLKHQEEGTKSENSSSHVVNLRGKVKELRSKLGEEKKQREIFEFEIKNLKEKVERLTKKEKEIEVQFETNRKKLLEIKTERDGLLLDLDSVNKRKKRDIEGYTSRIEALEKELKSLKGREINNEGGKQTKEALEAVNQQNTILEMKLATSADRYTKEIHELKTSLESLQQRYDSELARFKIMQTSNKNEILELKKSLSTLKRELENKTRELEKLRDNLAITNNEKERIENAMNEKSSEAKKWKKEAFDYKAEISFLRGALNILEKEGLTEKPPDIKDLATDPAHS